MTLNFEAEAKTLKPNRECIEAETEAMFFFTTTSLEV